MIALDKKQLLFYILSVVALTALVLLNGLFEDIKVILVASLLGKPLKPRPKQPHGGDGNSDVT
jgi:hypothetical protein